MNLRPDLGRHFAAVVTAVLLLARHLRFGLVQNENDVLPVARRFIQPSWLVGDWYLDHGTAYRFTFNLVAGPMVAALGFEWAALLGRVATSILFAVAIGAIARAVRLTQAQGVVFAFVAAWSPSLGAAEWMCGGFEAKAIAYPFVLFAIAGVLANAPPVRIGALLGVALAFHILIGLQMTFCVCVVFLARRDFRGLARVLLITCLAGFPGIVAIVSHARTAVGPAAAEASQIYAFFRVRHHTVVATSFFVCAAALGAITLHVWRRVRDRESAALAWIAGALLTLVLIGLTAQLSWNAWLAKLYWYRCADTLLPIIAAAAVLRRWDPVVPPASRALALQALGVVSAFGLVAHIASPWRPPLPPAGRLVSWIREETSPSSVFLINPTWEWFYAQAERPIFVSFKHSPQHEDDVREWYTRLTACAGGPLTQVTFGGGQEAAAKLARLTAAQLRDLAARYHIAYVIVPVTSPARDLPVAFSDDQYRVLDLRDAWSMRTTLRFERDAAACAEVESSPRGAGAVR